MMLRLKSLREIGEQVAKWIGEALARSGLSFVTLDMIDCRKNERRFREARRDGVGDWESMFWSRCLRRRNPHVGIGSSPRPGFVVPDSHSAVGARSQRTPTAERLTE